MTVAGVVETPTQLLAGGRVVTPEGVRSEAWLQLAGDRIVEITGDRPAVDALVVDLEGAWVLPGFVDLHMHGGGGHSVADSPQDMEGAVAFHQRHGTTSTLVSLVTAPVEDLVEQLGWVAELTRRGATPRGSVVGSHLEGPFLSSHRCGAQNEAHMIPPDLAVLEQLLEASQGALQMVTLAPELDGALSLIRPLRDAGVIVAMGHSDASYDQAVAAIAAGANHATHLFNAMPPLHHRRPGLVGAALEADIPCELINDGRHVHPAMVRIAYDQLTRPVLVTDAIDAAGVGDGRFELGGQEVEVQDGEARLARTGSLAGSTLTMDEAVRRAVTVSGLTIEQASLAASANPALVLGMQRELGSIAPALRADLVVLDDSLRVLKVMVAGAWCEAGALR